MVAVSSDCNSYVHTLVHFPWASLYGSAWWQLACRSILLVSNQHARPLKIMPWTLTFLFAPAISHRFTLLLSIVIAWWCCRSWIGMQHHVSHAGIRAAGASSSPYVWPRLGFHNFPLPSKPWLICSITGRYLDTSKSGDWSSKRRRYPQTDSATALRIFCWLFQLFSRMVAMRFP